MYYRPHSHSKGSQRKGNIIENIIRKRKYIYRAVLYLLKKIHVISGPTQFKLVWFKGQLYEEDGPRHCAGVLSKSTQPAYRQTSINDLPTVPQRDKTQTPTIHV